MSTTSKLISPEEIAVRAGEQHTFLYTPGAGVFAARALRLRALAQGHAMADFLRFVAELADAQHRRLGAAQALKLPSAEQIEAAARVGRPPLPAELWPRDPAWREDLRALLQDLCTRLPDGPARDAARRVIALPDETLELQASRLLGGVMLGLDMAAAPLIAAGLQLHFIRLVQQTQAAQQQAHPQLPAFGHIDDPTVCPCCGSRPVASLMRVGTDLAGARYLACGLCATQWYYVRIKCAHCQSTRGISLQRLVEHDEAGQPASPPVVEAETCSACGHYLKLVHQERELGAEPLADDLASLTLDLLLGGEDAPTPLQRHGVNLLLLFGDPDDRPPPGGVH